MASVMSDSASSDVPDGLELELLVEITTEVDSHLPANEAQWIDMLMNAYDAKVRLLPPTTSTSRLFHWVRKIAQLRRPGQRTWDCFKTICEESDIELGFEPSLPAISVPEPTPPPVQEAPKDIHVKVNLTSDPRWHSAGFTSDVRSVPAQKTPLEPPRSRISNTDEDNRAVLQTLNQLPPSRLQPSITTQVEDPVSNPRQRKHRYFPLTAHEISTLQHFSPDEIEEVAVARRHIVRQKAFTAWKNLTLSSQQNHPDLGLFEEEEQDELQHRRRLIAEARTIAMLHAQNISRGKMPETSENIVKPVKTLRPRIREDQRHLENITEEATLEEQAVQYTSQIRNNQPSFAPQDTFQSTRWQPMTQDRSDLNIGQRPHVPVIDESDDRAIPNAQELLQQARNVKAELYFEAWRQKALEKAKLAESQFQRTAEMKAELYVELWRDRARQKMAKEQALMRQVKEMKAELMFEEWNKNTRLYAVVEDNDRMYAEQYIIKWRTRSQRKNHLKRLADEHKYQWACEFIWDVLSKRKTRMDHLDGLVDLVQYYRNAIEPFNTWRTKAKTRQNERLADAYREARRLHKITTVDTHLKTWHKHAANQQDLLEHARAEVKSLRMYSAIEMMKRHVQKMDRLNLLVPIAREQTVLLHVEHCFGQWRDRARQWRAMKRLAEEMQQESRERVAIEAFKRWRAKSFDVLEARKNPPAPQDQDLQEYHSEIEEQEMVPEPETPNPIFRWKDRITEVPSTPKTAPALASKNARQMISTPKTAPGPGRFAAASFTPGAIVPQRDVSLSTPAPLVPEIVRAPRTILSKRSMLDPAAAPFRTPRRGRGPLFSDPVFFQKLQQVMPEHALLNERRGDEV
jgi:hypothetical protein